MTTSIFDSASGVKLLRQILNLNDQVKIVSGTDDPSVVAKDAPRSSLYLQLGGGTGIIFIKNDNGSSTNWTLIGTTASTSPFNATNYSIQTSVAASAMTVALKTQGGSDPSGGSPVGIAFRSSTLATGDYTVSTATAATSLVIPSTATMGQSDGQAAWIYVYAISNGGTVELAVSGTPINTEDRVTTVALGVGSDSSNVLYSTTLRSNVPCRYLGRCLNTQATAGTWATNSSQISLDNKDRRSSSFTRTSITAGATQAAATVNTDYILSTSYTVTVPRTGRYRIGFQGQIYLSDTINGSSWKAIRGRFGTSTTPGLQLVGDPFNILNTVVTGTTFDSDFGAAFYYESEPIFLASGAAIYLNTQWIAQSGAPGTVAITIDGSANSPVNMWLVGMDD